ncbi:hypothetical protein GCM10010495_34020 [Kitasatospora herbaricolor]|uniref:hypothetical protein n=1 Tax=Kitasatospora herbaricolor TaxID=68217 RepID=UPI00174889CA|nr:hypothetical protein [Kitasatospora herbaricolor]MDQ0307535.1 hypothetical protein [Kitasatospora herbaricolor]GGV16832.1 hypothetical protein GCM10010495_34020 [Kitasatospora herbaricolor]
MEIVYASLIHRQSGEAVPPGEGAEVVDVLWAHARSGDGLQHVSASPEPGRVDLLLYLTQGACDAPDAVRRAHALIARSHRISPWLNGRYLPPEPLAAPESTAAC